MAGPVFSNNAVGALAASYTAGATAITLVGGQGGLFPQIVAAGDWFPITCVDASNNMEIMRCTARTGDTLTVVRGQEGTNARALGAGDKVEHRLTAAALLDIRNAPITAAQIPDGSITGPKIAALAVTSGKIAIGAVGGPQIFDGAVDGPEMAVDAAIHNLGFRPVEEGGGIGQNSSKVHIGWSISTSKLKLTIDTTDWGNFLTERHDGTVNSAGYRGLVTNVQNGDYVFGLVDNGRQVLHTAGNNTYTVPSDASVPILIGGIIKVVNRGGAVAINPAAGIILRWLPSGLTGGRVLGSPGTCMLEKMDGGEWWIYGMGVT